MPIPAPFPYFGGKRTVAAEVWRRFGDVRNYVEPFFGSGAVLLQRPNVDLYDPPLETINDADGFVANFWRAMRAEPAVLAELVDWPVNECDLAARHKWLVTQPEKDEFLARMKDDPEYYDLQRAGWWCWGLCAWIGSGWCAGEWYGRGRAGNHGRGTCDNAAKMPSLCSGKGVHRKIPHLGSKGQGVNRQIPHLGSKGQGVNRKNLPYSTDSDKPCSGWFDSLAARLRRVRVCCGDWARVTGPAVTIGHGTTAVFLDPPYSGEAGRDNAVYRVESSTVAHDVREWCLEWGNHDDMRLALCGYEGEGHEPLKEAGWRVWAWKAHGGYGLTRNDGAEYENKHRERIWFSPGCLNDHDMPLFVDAEES